MPGAPIRKRAKGAGFSRLSGDRLHDLSGDRRTAEHAQRPATSLRRTTKLNDRTSHPTLYVSRDDLSGGVLGLTVVNHDVAACDGQLLADFEQVLPAFLSMDDSLVMVIPRIHTPQNRDGRRLVLSFLEHLSNV
jgi:hypothetical protein